MRPRNRLAYRLALPLAIVVSPAPGAGAGPIVAPAVVPAGESPGATMPKPEPKEVGNGARGSGRSRNGAALPSSPPRGRPASLKDVDRPSSGLGDPSVPRVTDEGDEVKEVTPLDQVPSSTQGLPSGGSLLLLPLPPDPEPGEAKPYAGEPSGTTGAAVGEVGSPTGAHHTGSLPRGPEDTSTPRVPVTLSPPGTPVANAPVERTPGDREIIPAASANSTDRGAGDPAPVLQAPLGVDAKASPGTAEPVVGSPNAANSPLTSSAAGPTVRDSAGAGPASAVTPNSTSGPASGSSAAGSTVRDMGGAGPAPAVTPGDASGPASTTPPILNPGGAKPTGVATEAGAAGRSTGVPSDSQTPAVANAPGPVSSGSGGTNNEAAQGTGGMSSMDKATVFGQMLTTAVLAQELTNPGRTGGGSQGESSTEKSPLAMSDRALLAEVGGTIPLDANPGASRDGGGETPPGPGPGPGPGAGTTAPSAPSVPLVPHLPLPAVEAGEGVRQAAGPGAMSGTPLSPSISPRAIPEPTPLLQVVVVLAGSAFVIARRRSQG